MLESRVFLLGSLFWYNQAKLFDIGSSGPSSSSSCLLAGSPWTDVESSSINPYTLSCAMVYLDELALFSFFTLVETCSGEHLADNELSLDLSASSSLIVLGHMGLCFEVERLHSDERDYKVSGSEITQLGIGIIAELDQREEYSCFINKKCDSGTFAHTTQRSDLNFSSTLHFLASGAQT
ncbi:10220_t:CDS:2 [Ambispora gerdemannii]|uniref:10220_t:CDS:1 n=1 Tax=Ambispora gerdemannii TaxID=144530 RepID=A0A9N8VEJ2_9GLOM|nr:10220_t:CDS:2 [Ambispora gerdemannii]